MQTISKRPARLGVLLAACVLLIGAGAFGQRYLDDALARRNTEPRVERPVPPGSDALIDAFHVLHYQHNAQYSARWLGVEIEKSPEDMLTYQEIFFDTHPDVIVDSGTAFGGSALYYASLCDLLGKGHVYSIDIEARPNRPNHSRITYLLGSSTAPEVLEQIRRAIKPRDRVMVILDSDHHEPHVLEELRAYGPLVTPGNYLVVEDTNVNGHPVLPHYGPGPMEAVDKFMAQDKTFKVDRSREKYLLTYFPRGYLLKLGGCRALRQGS